MYETVIDSNSLKISSILKLTAKTMLTIAIRILALLSNLSICSFIIAIFSFALSLVSIFHSTFYPFIERIFNYIALIKYIPKWIRFRNFFKPIKMFFILIH